MIESEIRARDPQGVERARAELPDATTDARLSRMRRILCDPVRFAIVHALGAGPLSVEDIALVVRRPPAGTSQHLRVLRDLEVVQVRKIGTTRVYGLRPDGLAHRIGQAIRRLLELAA